MSTFLVLSNYTHHFDKWGKLTLYIVIYAFSRIGKYDYHWSEQKKQKIWDHKIFLKNFRWYGPLNFHEVVYLPLLSTFFYFTQRSEMSFFGFFLLPTRLFRTSHFLLNTQYIIVSKSGSKSRYRWFYFKTRPATFT